MQQAEALLKLIKQLQRGSPALSFGMFSGYTERELRAGRYSIWGSSLPPEQRRDLWEQIRACLDFGVLGRFNQALPSREPLVTSRNQDLSLFSNRYSRADFSEQSVEVSIDESGLTQVTGFPVLGLPF